MDEFTPKDNLNTNYSNEINTAKNNLKPRHWLVGALVLVLISYFVGFQAGKKGYTFSPKEFKIINQDKQPQTVDYSLLWQAEDILNQKYIDKPVNPQTLLYGAIRGAVASTGDPYTDFFEPKELESFRTDLKGSFDGIGAEIDKRNGQIVIVAPLDGTPAQKAGLLAGDVILEVDGQVVVNWSVEEAVSHIRGTRGTQVTLSIYREGKNQPMEFKIIRDKIEVKSVKWQYKDITKENKPEKIAIITVSKFGDDTKQLFDTAVNEILTKNVKGLIVDLRNNPGGYLETSVDLASAWVETGQTVVKEKRSDGTETNYTALGLNRLSGLKTAVLINGGSASAAEILSGALQDYKLASLIGEKSFGKGSVQEIVDLKDGSAIKVTIAKWITPGGKNLNKDGLNPDVVVKLTEDDINNKRDPQMDKAIEELTKFK